MISKHISDKHKLLSIVIPVFNEADNISFLVDEIFEVMKNIDQSCEIIIVNDGSIDNTQQVIEGLQNQYKGKIRVIQLRRQSGKAAALHAGFQLAKGEIIITMDGDLQDDPNEISRFLELIDNGWDMVSGWKIKRLDSFVKNKTSKVFNFVTNLISDVKLHDFNCGFKAYKAEVAKDINLYGELHRYIPVLVSAKGYKVTEIAVNHRKRKSGKSKYGLNRFVHGFLDLATVLFITKFNSRPLHLFGYVGITLFMIGFALGVYLTGIKLMFHQSIGSRPLLTLSVLFMIIGVQIGITGLISEQISTMIHKDNINYKIKTIL